jgi:hypothetical protein
MVTQTISITSTHRSFRSSGTACEKEMQWTKGQKRHETRRAGHEVAWTVGLGLGLKLGMGFGLGLGVGLGLAFGPVMSELYFFSGPGSGKRSGFHSFRSGPVWVLIFSGPGLKIRFGF